MPPPPNLTVMRAGGGVPPEFEKINARAMQLSDRLPILIRRSDDDRHNDSAAVALLFLVFSIVSGNLKFDQEKPTADAPEEDRADNLEEVGDVLSVVRLKQHKYRDRRHDSRIHNTADPIGGANRQLCHGGLSWNKKEAKHIIPHQFPHVDACRDCFDRGIPYDGRRCIGRIGHEPVHIVAIEPAPTAAVSVMNSPTVNIFSDASFVPLPSEPPASAHPWPLGGRPSMSFAFNTTISGR
jgi:hypothetical protein